MASKGPDRWTAGVAIGKSASGPMQAVGGLFLMSADAVKYLFQRPFFWREFLEHDKGQLAFPQVFPEDNLPCSCGGCIT